MPFLFASLFVLAPLYIWRFSIGGLPTNFLMLANFVIIGVGVVMALRGDVSVGNVIEKFRTVFRDLGRPLLFAISLFTLASLISLFAFGINGEKLAQWMVLYAQPIVIFFLIRYFIPTSETDRAARQRWLKYFRTAAYVVVGAAGLLAIIQYFTLSFLPPQWWGNANEPKRAIAFFAHANAFGLFITPLLAWLIPDAVQKFRKHLFDLKDKFSFELIWPMLWMLGAAGIFFSLSRGAWLGLFAAAVVYILLAANKKMLIAFVVAAVVLAGVVAAVPNLRYRVLLPFQGEKSTVARFSLWDTAGKMIKDSPVLGKGVNGFSDNWDKYNTDPGLEHYNFPHNIFLNFWIDLGLLGLVSMLAILLLSVVRGFKRWRVKTSDLDRGNVSHNTAVLAMVLLIVAIVAHGLIDIPYLKNDLALVFWIALALGL